MPGAGPRSNFRPFREPPTRGSYALARYADNIFGPGSPIKVIGHRGAAAFAPENTLPAFRHALDIGADAVELDLHCTRDGALVCIHDDELDRTTDGSGPVEALTLEELQTLCPLAPLHQPHNLAAIRAIRLLQPDLPQVACFDTAFGAMQNRNQTGNFCQNGVCGSQRCSSPANVWSKNALKSAKICVATKNLDSFLHY